jgi:Domain of unknown function (DUF1737)
MNDYAVIYKDYRVLVAYRREDLATEIKGLFDDGWQPQGGVAIDRNGYYCQAMVKTQAVY